MPANRRDEPRPPERPAAPRSAPADVAEALARARQHARSAASEAVSAVRALLDAAALATSGLPSDASRLLAPLARGRERRRDLDAIRKVLEALRMGLERHPEADDADAMLRHDAEG